MNPKKRNGPNDSVHSGRFEFIPGNVLRSRAVSREVLSALWGLTSEFGMGSGGTPTLWLPGNLGVSRRGFKDRSALAAEICL